MFQRCYLLSLPFVFILTHVYAQIGMLDTTFGGQGIVITDIDGNDELRAIALQPDQKILAAGATGGFPGIGFIEDMAVARYMPDGSLDLDFGDAGIVRVDFPLDYSRSFAVAIQQDGRIVLGGLNGYTNEITTDENHHFALVRLNPNGSRDSSFGNAGLVVPILGGNNENVNKILIQEDGKLIAAGISSTLYMASFAMIRYESNGEVDHSFGNDGIVLTSIQDWNEAKTGVIQPDGKIILGGYARTDTTADFAMVRYKEDGTIDSLFGNDGIVQTDLAGGIDLAWTMLLEPDGKLVLGGYANFSLNPNVSDIGVVRYNSDGSLDKSFGNAGIDILSLGSQTLIHAMTRQPDGKYLLAGSSDANLPAQQWLLARIEHNGVLDTIFGTQGIIITNVEGELDFTLSVLIQNDSKIVVGGFNNGPGSRDFVLGRYLVDSLDHTGIQIIEPLSISISPNPCTDFISIVIEDQSGAFNCIISDLAGRIIRKETLYIGSDKKLLIDTKQLDTGFYLLGITNNYKSGVVSFVVEK